MFIRLSIVSALACLTLMLGACEEKPSAPARTIAPSTTPAATPAPEDHADHAGHAHDTVKTAVAPATPTIAKATETADTWAAKAQPLIEQATQYIKDHKYELAKQTLVKLDGLKPHLSASMQDQIANLHKLVDAANAASGIKLPGM